MVQILLPTKERKEPKLGTEYATVAVKTTSIHRKAVFHTTFSCKGVNSSSEMCQIGNIITGYVK
jgi:hypothetical protein